MRSHIERLCHAEYENLSDRSNNFTKLVACNTLELFDELSDSGKYTAHRNTWHDAGLARSTQAGKIRAKARVVPSHQSKM